MTSRDPNTPEVQYREIDWRCCLVTIRSLITMDSLLWGSTVGYPSDSLASCYVMFYYIMESLSTRSQAVARI